MRCRWRCARPRGRRELSLISRLRSIWRGVSRSGHVMAEMEAEFRDHIERRAADLEAEGVAREDALRRARLEFGSADRYREEGRAARGLRVLDAIGQDVRYGARML